MEAIGDALILDEAWSESLISQVDGAVSTPFERPGRTVEVEGEKLEEEEASMMGWSQVRRKKGQVETDVVAGSRGWEEYRRKFPHLAYNQRRGWSEMEEVKRWLAGGDEKEIKWREGCVKRLGGEPKNEKVEKWLRGGGGQE